MKTLKHLLTIASCALVLGACSSPVKLDESAASVDDRGTAGGAATAGAATAGGASGRQVASVNVDARDALNDPNSPLSKRSIYFDFDSYTIRDEYRGTLEAHARYLATNKGRKVIIQGNTDERGSREYNLALGQKRAEAVRKALAALGVADAQLEAVSLGEEKPRATGSDETAWAENRRADLAYQ
ncbi:MAG: peptidoglycan-associated lipoprotein Pal [Pseudomonadota bacterium]